MSTQSPRGSSQRKRKAWTAAAAARSARDMRALTSDHLANTRVARLWEANSLQRAYEIHMRRLRNPDAAMNLLLTGMGYPPPWPTDWEAIADMVALDAASTLRTADLYIMSPALLDVVVAAAKSLAIEDLLLLDATDPPTPTGLLVLPHPLITRTIGGELSDIRALHWHQPVTVPIARDEASPVRESPAVRITSYMATAGPVQPDGFKQFRALTKHNGEPLPPLLLDGKRAIPFQPPDTVDLGSLKELRDAARSVDGATRAFATSAGLDTDEHIGEYSSGEPIDDIDDQFTFRFMYAFWRLCSQEIAALSNGEVTPRAQLISERAEVSPDVRVAQLRIQRQSTRTPETPGHEWQHRWVVRMHRVRQWYPSEQRHKIIYRGPYVKGPDGKPFIGGDVVRGLIR